jgi:hypothetical protein
MLLPHSDLTDRTSDVNVPGIDNPRGAKEWSKKVE